MTRSTSPPTRSPAKATLFCPECSHRSRYDGDWLVTETDDGRRYRCPDCRTTVTVRPAFDAGEPGTADAVDGREAREHPEELTVVVLPDTGERYPSTELFGFEK